MIIYCTMAHTVRFNNVLMRKQLAAMLFHSSIFLLISIMLWCDMYHVKMWKLSCKTVRLYCYNNNLDPGQCFLIYLLIWGYTVLYIYFNLQNIQQQSKSCNAVFNITRGQCVVFKHACSQLMFSYLQISVLQMTLYICLVKEEGQSVYLKKNGSCYTCIDWCITH